MVFSGKRPVGRPRKDGQPPKEKRPVGRPPNHAPVNRYTGIRAQNIDYVRQYIRRWLEAEEKGEHRIYMDGGRKRAMAVHFRTVLVAVRLLLACEEIFLYDAQHTKVSKLNQFREKLVSMGDSINKGETKLPDLLLQFDKLDKEASSDD